MQGMRQPDVLLVNRVSYADSLAGGENVLLD